MVESAAHLIDQVLREQPIRQWLLIFPYRLRFLFAAQPQVLSGVLGVVYRAISTCLVRKSGFTVASGAKTGAITLIQRFCSASSMMRPVNARSTARSSDTWRSAGRSNAGQKGPDNIFDMYSRAAISHCRTLHTNSWAPAARLAVDNAIGGAVILTSKEPRDYLETDRVALNVRAAAADADEQYRGGFTAAFQLGDLGLLAQYTHREFAEQEVNGPGSLNPQGGNSDSLLLQLYRDPSPGQ